MSNDIFDAPDVTLDRREQYHRKRVEKAKKEREIKCPGCGKVIGMMDRSHSRPSHVEDHECPAGNPTTPSAEIDVNINMDALSVKLRKFDGAIVDQETLGLVRATIEQYLDEVFVEARATAETKACIEDLAEALTGLWKDAAGRQ